MDSGCRGNALNRNETAGIVLALFSSEGNEKDGMI